MILFRVKEIKIGVRGKLISFNYGRFMNVLNKIPGKIIIVQTERINGLFGWDFFVI